MEPSQQEITNIAAHFLSRVQLTGQEVPAFNHVMNWLETFAVDPTAK